MCEPLVGALHLATWLELALAHVTQGPLAIARVDLLDAAHWVTFVIAKSGETFLSSAITAAAMIDKFEKGSSCFLDADNNSHRFKYIRYSSMVFPCEIGEFFY